MVYSRETVCFTKNGATIPLPSKRSQTISGKIYIIT